jgi:hypothetical protein
MSVDSFHRDFEDDAMKTLFLAVLFLAGVLALPGC